MFNKANFNTTFDRKPVQDALDTVAVVCVSLKLHVQWAMETVKRALEKSGMSGQVDLVHWADAVTGTALVTDRDREVLRKVAAKNSPAAQAARELLSSMELMEQREGKDPHEGQDVTFLQPDVPLAPEADFLPLELGDDLLAEEDLNLEDLLGDLLNDVKEPGPDGKGGSE